MIMAANAQKGINPSEAINHVRDGVTITDGILGGRYLSDSWGPYIIEYGRSLS